MYFQFANNTQIIDSTLYFFRETYHKVQDYFLLLHIHATGILCFDFTLLFNFQDCDEIVINIAMILIKVFVTSTLSLYIRNTYYNVTSGVFHSTII